MESCKLLNVNLDRGLGSAHDVLELAGFRVQADAVLVARCVHGGRAGRGLAGQGQPRNIGFSVGRDSSDSEK